MENPAAHTTKSKNRRGVVLFALLVIGGIAAYWFDPGHTDHFYLMCNADQYASVTVRGFFGEEERACQNEFYPVWQPFQDRADALATAVECVPQNDQLTPLQAIPALRDNWPCPVETPASMEETTACTALPECEQYDRAHCVCLT